MLHDSLILLAWVEVHPDMVYKEFVKSLDLYLADSSNFKFKVISPLYPFEREALTDQDYYKNLEIPWTYQGAQRFESRIERELEPVLDGFKRSRFVDKEKMRHELRGKKLKDFDENFDYL